jgi:amino acid adenylation domain-containing protein
LIASLKRLGLRENSTIFVTLLTALKILLYRYSGQRDIAVGTAIAGRNSVEVEGLIGFFVNTLVLLTSLSGMPTFRELLGRVRETVVGASVHQELPFEKLIEQLQPERELSRTPLFQVMFVLQNTSTQTLKARGLEFSALETSTATTKFDLALSFVEMEQGLIGSLEYSTDLFDQGTIERMAGHFKRLLQSIVDNPDRLISTLPLLGETEQSQLLEEWNETAADYPKDQFIHTLFERRVEELPDSVAVSFEDGHISYRELNRRANQLAHYLRNCSVGPELVVAICTERSLEMVVALLGVLKSGAAYLPLDPNYPKQRLSYMLEDSQANLLLTQRKISANLPDHNAKEIYLESDWEFISALSDRNPPNEVSEGNAAYVMYTSGSTGQPKGVIGLHGATINRFNWMWERFPFSPSDVCCQKTNLSFGDSVWEIFGPLLAGVPSVIIPDEEVKDPHLLAESLAKHRVSRIVLVPSLLRAILERVGDVREKISCVRLWVSSGEALGADLSKRFKREMSEARLLNLYGSSEVAADASWHEVSGDEQGGTVAIGKPIANIQTYVVDEQKQVSGIGIRGELHIAGEGVGRGYHRRADLTAEKYLPNPYGKREGERMYATGDLAKVSRGGEIEYLGRIDHQVKLRGYRIELGEIEAQMMSIAGVREAAVKVEGGTEEQRRLVGYIVEREGAEVSVREVREGLREKLPEYMVPAVIVKFEELPRTPGGKIDRKRLPAPQNRRDAQEREYVKPSSVVEEVIAGIWSEVLGIEEVGVEDNFFDLRGHSLLATQVMSRIREALAVELPLRSIFEAKTVRKLAKRLEEARGGSDSSHRPIERINRENPIPLSYAQERLWFLHMLQPGDHFYNIPTAVRLKGTLNIATVEECLNEVVRRHESLRTRFVTIDEQPAQVITVTQQLSLVVVDLSRLSEHVRERRLQTLAGEEAGRVFDLNSGNLMRVKLVTLSQEEHVMMLTLHHIVSDQWSMGVLVKDVCEIYEAYSRGAASQLEELRIQYADYANWERQWLSEERLDRELQYWKQQLRGAPAVLDLSRAKNRPEVQSYRGDTRSVVISKDQVEAVRKMSRREGVTTFMSMLSVFNVLLHYYTGRNDIVVGTAIANRRRLELEGVIGFFVNQLALRTKFAGDPSFLELIKIVRNVTLEAYDHQGLPFVKLVQELNPTRSSQYSPIFQVCFLFENAPAPPLELSDLTISNFQTVTRAAKFDLILGLLETEASMAAAIEYNIDLFDVPQIDHMLNQFKMLLRDIISRPDIKLSELYETLARVDKEKETAIEKELEEIGLKKLKRARPRIIIQ